MEEALDAASSLNVNSNSGDSAAVFVASRQARRIDSNICLGINTVSNPENLVYATLDWEHVSNDLVRKHHHDMFTPCHDAETCKLVDPDGLHPFCLASKLNTNDHPSFKEVLHMDKELHDDWFDAMDKNFKTCSNPELLN